MAFQGSLLASWDAVSYGPVSMAITELPWVAPGGSLLPTSGLARSITHTSLRTLGNRGIQ